MVTFVDITERKRAQTQLAASKAEIEARLREASALLGVAEAVGGTLELTEALRRICRAIARLTGADTVAAYLIDGRTQVLRPAAGYRVPPTMLEGLPEAAIPIGPCGLRETSG